MTDENLDTYLDTDTIIEMTKAQHDIRKPNSEMSDGEIAEIMRFLGSSAPDTIWSGDKPMFGRIGLGLMLSLTLYDFPGFYERHELSQMN